MTEVDARQLVAAHQSGDERAFSQIAELSYPSLYQHAWRRLGSHHAAEDAVQETFVRAYRALPRFEGDFRLQAWLHRILENVCIDEGGRRSREGAAAERIGSLRGPSPSDPADLTVLAEGRAAVTAALAELPDAYRTAVAMRYLDGLSYQEVAVATGVTEENARARVSRGRAVLRRAFGQGAAALIVVFPFLRRAQRGVAAADPATAPPVALGEGVAPVLANTTSAPLANVASGPLVNVGAGPLSNVSAQLAGHVAQAAPAVSRLAEVSLSVTDGRASAAAKVAGVIAAVVMPAAYGYVAASPPAPAPSGVVVEAAAGVTDGGNLVATTTTAPVGSIVTIVPTSTTIPSGPTTTSTIVAGSPKKAVATVGIPGPAPAPAADADTAPAPAVVVIPAGRRAGIVSDDLSVLDDGSRLRVSGPIGFALADKDQAPSEGRAGQLSGEVFFREGRDGLMQVTARFEMVIDGRSYTFWLDGYLQDPTAPQGETPAQFVGSYRLDGASALGLEERGDASGALEMRQESAEGDPARPASLRLSLGDRSAPSEAEAG
jgi:RNA polymerase sigma-70 factor (ECF subfamily)